jgi:putative acetyltransferase
MLTIRPERPEDYLGIFTVNQRAFDRENEARLVEALRALPGFIPELSLVAEENGRLLGHILFSPAVLANEKGEISVLALAPMAVQPELQNRGIGSALVRQGLDACRRQGHKLVIVLGHAEYYPRFGFVPARALGIEAPFPVADEFWMAMELQPGAAQGLNGTIRYSEPFNAV